MIGAADGPAGHDGVASAAGTGRGNPSNGPWTRSVRRFRSNRLALWSLYVIASLVLAALLAPLLAPHDPLEIGDVMATRFQPPSWVHPFGTDAFGRDVLSRSLFGARISLAVGIIAMLLSTAVGTAYGSIAGYFGGLVDEVLMRIVDVWIAFPAFYLMLLLVGVFEASVPALILVLALTAWPATARLVRGEILSLKEREYVLAARAMGLPARRIIIRHLIPGTLSPVLVTGALAVAAMIGAEAGLSFLGLGISPPTPSWGNMVASGKDVLGSAWWISFFPGALLTITLVAFSLVADGLRDALDPRALDQRYV
jgi:peptide/nickel transport system permease protein